MADNQAARISPLIVIVPAMAIILLPGAAKGGLGAQLAMLFTELMLGLPALVLLPKLLRGEIIPLRWPKRISQLTLALLIVVGAPLFQLISYANDMLLPVPEEVKQQMAEHLSTTTIASMLITWISVVLVSPVMEEIFFRGFIQWLWSLRFSRARSLPALVVPAAVFALFHMNPWQFPSLLLLGLWLAWLRVWSGSLLPGIVFHMAINLLAMLLL